MSGTHHITATTGSNITFAACGKNITCADGANIYEARYAQGRKDFISKLEIALKEASEAGYWLELLHRTNYIDDAIYQSLKEQCASIRVMLVASCKTAKNNMNG